MPPDPQKNRLQLESDAARQARELAEESNRRAKERNAINSSPAGRSAYEKSTSPTLAERILPGHPAGQQYLRQALDTATSAAGGAMAGGGLPGALMGAAGSGLAFMLNPNQAQEIGSATNLANLAAPGAVRGLQALKPVAGAMKNYPGLTGGALGFLEGGAQGAATGMDTGNSPAELGIGQGLLNAVFRGGAQHMQAGGRELPAAVSQDIRKGLTGLSEKSAGSIPPGTDAPGLLAALTKQFSRLSSYIETPEEAAKAALERAMTAKQLSDAQAQLPKLKTAAKAAQTKATNLSRQAAVDEAFSAEAVGMERARSKDFIKSYPTERTRLDAEIERLKKAPNRFSPEGEKAYDDALKSRERLENELDLAMEGSSNEALLKQRVAQKQQSLLGDFDKKAREAAMDSNIASAKVRDVRKEIDRLANVAQSYVTREEVRNEALDGMVKAGIRDPRLFTDEAKLAVRNLVSDPKFSAQSFFEKTVEAKSGAEVMSKGLMDAIGNDSTTKAAVRTRYVQHLFDSLQEGLDENVYGKTFNPKKFDAWFDKIKGNSRAFNNFMENDEAYKTLYALAERLRKGSEGLNNPSFGIHLGWGAASMGAYVGGHMVSGSDGEDTGGLLLRLGTAAAGASLASRFVNWKTIANNLLQAKGTRAKAIQKFLESDDPGRLPQDVVKTAVRAMYGDEGKRAPQPQAR